MLRLRLLRWLVLAAVLTAGTMVASSGTAHACSCMLRELSEYADGVSVAFAGHQLDRVVQDYVDDNGAALLFRVERVYKGEAGPLIEVRTHAQGPACGIDVGGQGSVGVVANEWRGDLSVNLCGSVVAIGELEEVFGAGYPPDESIRLPVLPDPEEYVFYTGQPPDDGLVMSSQPVGSSRDQSLPAVLIVAGAVLLVSVGAVIWHRRR
ncbi:MAG: hypothetical protein OXC00_14300 [Acidimicrobiaceae bacterium]|nr:hypothetical protein [Acidimicrobiaceae bacterium]